MSGQEHGVGQAAQTGWAPWRVIEEEEDIAADAALSFLDIVSAGFGSAIFLFVLFSSLPLVPPTAGAGTTEFIDVVVEMSEIDTCPLVELQVIRNREIISGTALRNSTVDAASGTIIGIAAADAREIIASPMDVQGNRFGAHCTRNEQSDVPRTIAVRVIGPEPGAWNFALNVFAQDVIRPNARGAPGVIEAHYTISTHERDEPERQTKEVESAVGAMRTMLLDENQCILIQPTDEVCD